MVALICDDDAVWCRAMSRVLTGYQVLHAHDIESALHVAEKTQPSVVMLDSLLPDGIGWQAIPRFREVAPYMAIVVMTAHARRVDGLRVIGAEYRAFGYLDKGEGAAEIRRTIQSAVMASLVGAIRDRFAPLSVAAQRRILHRHRA